VGKILGTIASIAVIIDVCVVHGPRLLRWISGDRTATAVPRTDRTYNISVNILLLVALGLSSWSVYLYYNKSNNAVRTFTKPPTIEVRGRDFSNELVVLDDHLYSHCSFTNVTFKYNGTGPSQMVNNTINGHVKVDSDDGAVIAAWMLARFVGGLTPNIPFTYGPDNLPMPSEPMRPQQ